MKAEFEVNTTDEKTVSIAEAKSSFSEYISRVAYAGERILITKRGKPIAGLVSYKELEKIKKLKKADGLKGIIGQLKEFEGFSDTLDEVYADRKKDGGRDVSF